MTKSTETPFVSTINPKGEKFNLTRARKEIGLYKKDLEYTSYQSIVDDAKSGAELLLKHKYITKSIYNRLIEISFDIANSKNY